MDLEFGWKWLEIALQLTHSICTADVLWSLFLWTYQCDISFPTFCNQNRHRVLLLEATLSYDFLNVYMCGIFFSNSYTIYYYLSKKTVIRFGNIDIEKGVIFLFGSFFSSLHPCVRLATLFSVWHFVLFSNLQYKPWDFVASVWFGNKYQKPNVGLKKISEVWQCLVI